MQTSIELLMLIIKINYVHFDYIAIISVLYLICIHMFTCIIFSNDLPKYLHSSTDPVFLNSNPINCLMYADDIILLSSSAH